MKSRGICFFEPLTIFMITCIFMVFNCINPTDGSDPNQKQKTIKDIDGNVYKIVKIGDQWWMAENLNVTRYRNGDVIPDVTSTTAWENLTINGYCNYENNEINAATYGRLYSWYAVTDPRRLAPAGWHLPSDEEWKQLELLLGMSQSVADQSGWRGSDEGGKLKVTGTMLWNSPNTAATNTTGFAALPGGCRNSDGDFGFVGEGGYFWSSTEFDASSAWARNLFYHYAGVVRDCSKKNFGRSVRCVRDN